MVIRDGQKHLPWSILPLAVCRFRCLCPAPVRPKLLQRLWRSLRGGLLIRFGDRVVLPQTAGSLTTWGALFIVLLAPCFPGCGHIWARAASIPQDHKCVIGLVAGGLAFVPLVWANDEAASGHLASVWWLALAYVVIEVGEVCLSPITLAAISELTMPKVAAVMMSGWLLATSFSEQLAALFSSFASFGYQARRTGQHGRSGDQIW